MVCCFICGAATGGTDNCCKKFHIPITWVLALLATAGVAMLIAGGATLGTAEESTTLEVIKRFQDFYEKTEQDDMQLASVTAPSGFTLNSTEYNWTAVSRAGVSTPKGFTEYFWIGEVPRAASSSQSVQVSFLNNVASAAAQSTIVSPSVPLTLGGKFLSELCFVVTRKDVRNAPYETDSNYDSCYYPFKETSNKYDLTAAPSTLKVKIISFGDPALPIEQYGKSTRIVKDEDVLLAPGWALPALVVGVILTVVFLPAVACVVCLCWDHPPAVMRRIAFSIFCPCCVDQSLPVKDPLQVGCGQPTTVAQNVANEAGPKITAV